ncbi:MAG: peptidylprolyl isomerase [Pseudomonadota bacterium]
MKIAKGKVVSFSYTLSEHGEQIETSYLSDNIRYLHGYKNMLDGIEEALENRQSGDSLSVTLTPEQAYGRRRNNSIERVPLKYVGVKKPPKAGDVVNIQTPKGIRQAVVVKAGRFNVDVDTNHPLAGKTLTFDITVGSVRDAESEEIQHGHAHGDGGHAH